MTADNAHSVDPTGARKRIQMRYLDAVVRRRCAEIEMRQANGEYQLASTAFMEMLVEERKADRFEATILRDINIPGDGDESDQ